MFGIIGAALFGTVAYGAWAKSNSVQNEQRNQAKKDNSDCYIDRNGILRHSNTGFKYTKQDFVKQDGFSRRERLEIDYKEFVEQYKIDSEWYTFHDYIIWRYKNDHVTGKHYFPGIDWDNVKEKPWRKPKEYFYYVDIFDNQKPHLKYLRTMIFDTKDEVIEFISTFNEKDFRGWRINGKETISNPLRECKGNVYKGVDHINYPKKYVFYKTGKVIDGFKLTKR